MTKFALTSLALAISGVTLAFAPAAVVTDSGFELTPTVDADTSFATKGGTRTTQLILAPAVNITHSNGAVAFQSALGAALGLDIIDNDGSTQTGFIDLNADAAFRFAHSQALSSDIGAGLVYAHTDDNVAGDDGDYAQALTSGAFAGLQLGNADSQLRMSGTLSVENTRFTNYQDTVGKDKNGTAIGVDSDLSYLLASATRYELELSAKSSTFDDNEPAYNLGYGLMTGLSWQQVANTQGKVLVGLKGVDYSNNGSDNYTGWALDSSISLAATSFLEFNNTLTSEVTTSSNNRKSEAGLGAKWALSDTLGLGSELNYTNNCKLKNSTAVKLAAQYDARRFLQLGLGYELTLPEEGDRGHKLAFNLKAGL